MYYKTITKEIFASYIANETDPVLEGVVTDTKQKVAMER